MLEEKHELHKEDVLTVADELRAEQLAPLEHDDAVSDHAVVVPELESDSQLIEGLALRADPDQQEEEKEHADDLRATAAEATDPVDTLRHPQDAETAAVSNGPGTARIPPQKGNWGQHRQTDRISGISAAVSGFPLAASFRGKRKGGPDRRSHRFHPQRQRRGPDRSRRGAR